MHTLSSGVAMLSNDFTVLHTEGVLLLSNLPKAAVHIALALYCSAMHQCITAVVALTQLSPGNDTASHVVGQ